MKISAVLLAILGFIIPISDSLAADGKVLKDLEYAEIGDLGLKLDLYLPPAAQSKPTLIVWVHGGAWRAGSKDRVPIKALIDHGFAIASVDYRLTPVARFPANIHDIKAAIRWLRASAGKYGHAAAKIGIAGASAGGHLVNLIGTSNGHPGLEGKEGEHLDQSSDVAAIVSFYGAANLTTILHQSTPHGLGVRIPALQLLLGGQPEAREELAKLASPVFQVNGNEPPLLLIHGDQDHQMPVNQSIELFGKYREYGLPVQMDFVHGAGHGGAAFYNDERMLMVAGFFAKHLSPAKLKGRDE
jgi:acetyl esterase/lipase